MAKGTILAALFHVGALALAWDSHYFITQLSLSNAVDPQWKVEFKDRKSSGVSHEQLKIHKSWDFPLKLNELVGKSISAIDILSVYSDEPDWGIDQNLFESDQYPELWNEDSPYVTFKTGFKSQAFRHVHFPGKFSWADPITSIQVPMRPLGEGHERAVFFYALSQDLFKRGEDYWALRFLAWSLHYIQDLHQPFHASQTPTKKFIRFKWQGWLPSIDIPRTGETIGYYHLGYERWVDLKLKENESPLVVSLKSTSKIPLRVSSDELLIQIVREANLKAPEIGKLSLEILPQYRHDEGSKSEDITSDPKWIASVVAHPKMPVLLTQSEEIFSKMGSRVRFVVDELLSKNKKSR